MFRAGLLLIIRRSSVYKQQRYRQSLCWLAVGRIGMQYFLLFHNNNR